MITNLPSYQTNAYQTLYQGYPPPPPLSHPISHHNNFIFFHKQFAIPQAKNIFIHVLSKDIDFHIFRTLENVKLGLPYLNIIQTNTRF